jgi:hypothetical protein
MLHSPAGEKDYKKLKAAGTGARHTPVVAPAIAEFLGIGMNDESKKRSRNCVTSIWAWVASAFVLGSARAIWYR